MQMIPAGPDNLLHKKTEGAPDPLLYLRMFKVLQTSRLRARTQADELGAGTFAGSIALVLPPSFVIEAHIDLAGNMSLIVDGHTVDADTAQTFREGQVEYEPFVPGLGQQLVVEAKPFKVSVLAVKAYTDEATGYNRAHLDLRAEASSLPLIKPHGILGQTLELLPGDAVTLEEASFAIPTLTCDQGPSGGISLPTRRLLAESNPIMPLRARFAILKAP